MYDGIPLFIRGHSRRGVKTSQETLEKIRTNMPDFNGKNNPMYGRKQTETETDRDRDRDRERDKEPTAKMAV